MRVFDGAGARWAERPYASKRGVYPIGQGAVYPHHGGVIFLTLSEEGKQVQIIAERSLVSEREFRLLKSAVDTGDILLVTGTAGLAAPGPHPSLCTAGRWRRSVYTPFRTGR